MSYRFTKAVLLASTVMAGAIMASPVVAQVDDQDTSVGAADASAETGEPIIVTGSRIARRNIETAAPIAVVDDEEFQLSGAVNVENVVNALPQVIPGTTSFSNNPGNGTATLNLRGLGSNRTLVLVNGRRWMFYDTAQVVDLNTIPNFLIDSVDVVTGGASAVYGSDALAGVVNFRLRQVDGVELGGQYAITERGDGASYQVHGAIGTSFDDGRGSATVFAEYFNRESVFQSARDFSYYALGGESFGDFQQQFGSSTVPQGRIGFPGRVQTAPSVDLNGDGDFTDAGETPTSPIAEGLIFDDAFFSEPGSARRYTGADAYNYAVDNYLMIPQERYLMGGYADYDIGGGHKMYTEVAYVNNRVAQELAPTPVTGTYNIDIATVAPFLSDAMLAELNAIDANEAAVSAERVANGLSALPTAQLGVVSATVQRRVTETGSRNSLDERNAFRVLGGMTGPIGDYLTYDAHYFYARTRNANVQAGNISRSAFQAGLNGTADPINIFGPGTLTPEMVDQISIQAQNGDISTLEVANASISGTFGDFALGADSDPIGFAVGAEYRRVASQFIPDTALSSGDVIGFNAGDATEGSYSVKELFAEVVVPVQFGSARLELTGAGRYSDYSLDRVGGVWTYAGGVEFSPIPDVILRGQYQRAIRAPNIAELFQGQAIGFPGVVDPCSNQDYLDATPGAAQLCLNTGVPAGNLGGGTAVQPNAQIPALFGGNPNLFEETSESFTAGVVFQPSFIPGFTLTADYFDIKVDNAISTISLQTTFDLCFGGALDFSAPECQTFVGIRNTDGQITVDAPPSVGTANIASLGVKGVDLEANYSTSVPFSLMTDTGEADLRLSFLGTWTDSSFFEPVAGGETIYECAGYFGGNCGQPTAKWKWTSRLSLADGPLTTSVAWRHLSAVDDHDDSVDYDQWNGSERIPAYDIFDLTFAFDVTEAFSMNIGVNNLLDTLPQSPTFDGIYVDSENDGTLLGDNQEQANTYPSTYDVLGRRFFVSASLKF